MKVKPKDVTVVLPAFFLFDDQSEITAFAQNVNRIMHGHTRVKYEELGMMGQQYVGVFYLERNREYSEFRAFVKNSVCDKEYHDFVDEDI